MGRREDLERLIRDSYGLIRGYEEQAQTTDRPEEELRARRMIEGQWAQIERYMAEYRPIVSVLPEDIAQIAAHFAPSPKPKRSRKASRIWMRTGGILGLVLLGGSILVLRVAGQWPFHSAVTHKPPSRASLGATWARKEDGAVMVYVPAGEFWMGSDEGDIDEKPRHRVYVDAFWIDRTEVTNAQYRKCVEEGTCSAPSKLSSYTRDSYYNNPAFDDYPVVWVSWAQARQYAAWVGGRLPTEAEWEHAARGPNVYAYPWGNSKPNDSRLNYDGLVGDTTAVGSYSDGASWWCGALDMAGNVWEWTQSLYRTYPYDAKDGREDLDSVDARVLRGGSFSSSATGISGFVCASWHSMNR